MCICVVPFDKFDNDLGIGHVIKGCLEQEFVLVLSNKTRRIRELDFLCSVFSDEGKRDQQPL